MHILFVIASESSVPYFTWFADKARSQDKHRFTFVALSSKPSEMVEEMEEKGWGVYWIKYNSINRKRGMIKSFFQLYFLFKKLKPDIVHSHLFDDSLPAMFAARLAGIKKRVLTKQDTTFHWYYAPSSVKFDRFNNRNATDVVAIANENKKFILEKEKCQPQKVHLVRHGMPYHLVTSSRSDFIEELRTEYQMEGRIVIGTVARYIHWKAHHLLIEAAQKLIEKYPNLLFVWAGSDGGTGYKKNLQEEVKRYNLQNHILMLDWVDRIKIPSLYKCMDIYLHPALNEPYGFVITEALMNRVPVISTRAGATNFLEHLKDGYLLEQDSVDDILKGVSSLLDDADLRNRLGESGCRVAKENCTFDHMWEGYMEIYESK